MINFSTHINFKKQDGINILPPIPVQLKNQTAIAEVKKVMDNFYQTTVSDSNKTVLGRHHYEIDKNALLGKIMTTHPYQSRLGIGEVMRLVSIMEMLANNIEKNVIYATPSAFFFHTKYQFNTHIDNPNITNILNEMLNSDCCNEDNRAIIKKMLDLGNQARTQKDNQIIIDKLIQNYVKEKISRNKTFGYSEKIPMKLELKDIKNNAEFFNKLFKKHRIDFTI